ncbi:MAG: FG-GAP repeat protein, partial [Bacteroidetes bacterium]|nr:FG-GAP repeat protein [Bacteroidota bacterium]
KKKKKNVGLVEVFTFFEGKWKVDAVLRAPIPIADSRFGHALASSGNTILVGAPSTNSKTGEAVIYTLENGKWIATPLASDARPGYEFGASVALLGDNMAIVGAPGKDLRRSTVGALYIYEKGENNQWNMIQSINGNAKIENLGTSLAVRGNTLVAGAYDEVVIFNWNENKWDLTEEIENPNAGETFSFASSINLSPDGKNLLISASNHVFIYRSVGDSWALLNSLTDDNPRYGSASAIGNDFFLINSPYAGENMMEGAVYLHLIPTDTDEILLR